MKKLLKGCFVCLLALTLGACSSKPATENKEVESKTIKMGVVGSNNEYWTPVIEKLKADGITLELVVFTDYAIPNRALNDGELDLNSFQHYAYLNKEIADMGYEIEVLGNTIIAPLGIYSKKITSLDELKEGDQIAIPQDATNGGRSLKILEAAGLIKVDPAAGYTPEVKDITENKLNLQIVQVEASQTASLLEDVAAGFINGAHAVDNGYNPSEDAIYVETVEEGSDNPYINVLAVRSADKENPDYLKVLEAFQSAEVAEVLTSVYKGAYAPAWNQ